MIKQQGNKTVLEFGTGDICVNDGYIPTENSEKIVGIVGFKNQSSREIGEGNGDIKAGEYDSSIFDVLMKFTNVKSIDVIIDALKETRKQMVR